MDIKAQENLAIPGLFGKERDEVLALATYVESLLAHEHKWISDRMGWLIFS